MWANFCMTSGDGWEGSLEQPGVDTVEGQGVVSRGHPLQEWSPCLWHQDMSEDAQCHAVCAAAGGGPLGYLSPTQRCPKVGQGGNNDSPGSEQAACGSNHSVRQMGWVKKPPAQLGSGKHSHPTCLPRVNGNTDSAKLSCLGVGSEPEHHQGCLNVGTDE